MATCYTYRFIIPNILVVMPFPVTDILIWYGLPEESKVYVSSSVAVIVAPDFITAERINFVLLL